MKPITTKQMATAQRIALLTAKHVRGTITEQEADELGEWVGSSHKTIKLFEEMTDPDRIKKALELLKS